MGKDTEETIANRISQILAERIVRGELVPGSRLRQDPIADEFQTSHVPVREALRRLEAQGLAVSEPRRGVRVAAFDVRHVREVAEMRAVLEVLALQHAAPNLTSAILDEAAEAARQADSVSDVSEWEAANRRFHAALLKPCGMDRLLATIDDLQAASARFLFSAWQSGWEKRTDQDHQFILAALRDGKTEEATARLRTHVQRIGRPPSDKRRDAFAIIG